MVRQLCTSKLYQLNSGRDWKRLLNTYFDHFLSIQHPRAFIQWVAKAAVDKLVRSSII